MQQTISFIHLNKEKMIIGILGPQGTYSEKAAKQWNEGATLQFYEDIFDTVDALLRNEVDHSIVPIENSLEGSLTLTLDLLMDHQLKITGEVIVQVKQLLLAKGNIGGAGWRLSFTPAIGSSLRRCIFGPLREKNVKD